MAGVIAGRDSFTGEDNNGLSTGSFFAGAASGARIVSVKAAGATGATDVSQVLARIDPYVMAVGAENTGTPSTAPTT